MSQYTIDAGTGQDIGDRKEQQDRVALLVAPKAPGYLLAVLADGMGGQSGGAMAADQVIQTARQQFDTFSPLTDTVHDLLQHISLEAHTVIQLNGMSTENAPHSTVVMLVLTPDREAFWAHVGDSRLYRFVGPNFVERTTDHSYVEKLIADGKLSPNDAKRHKLGNVLTNVLGSDKKEPVVTLGQCAGLKAGMAFLLCSDGLWNYLEDMEMGAALSMNRPKEAAQLLIRQARARATDRRGDNCSLAIVKLVPIEAESRRSARHG